MNQNGDSRNGDKPKRRQSKRRQAETATNHNGDIHFKQAKTATVQTATNRNGDIYSKRIFKTSQTAKQTVEICNGIVPIFNKPMATVKTLTVTLGMA